MPALTRLAAVNIMLSAAEEQPVNTLVDNNLNDVSQAEDILDEITLQVQVEGYGVNVETKEFNYDANGKIAIGSNILAIDPAGNDTSRSLTVIDGYLYDNDDNTDVFTDTVMLTISKLLDFEQLPAAVQYYITHSAARRYQMLTLGDPDKDRFLAEQELKARAKSKATDARERNDSWINNPYGPSQQIAFRRRTSRRYY